MHIVRLDDSHRPALLAHFLSLGVEDRHLRFGFTARDGTIERYAGDIDFTRDAVFGVRGASRRFDGIVHLALENNHAEIGVSVLASARGRGIGSALVERAAAQARDRGIKVLFVQCLSENRAMVHIARTLGMKVIAEGIDSTTSLALRRASPVSLLRELAANQIALCDAALSQTLLKRETHKAPSARGYVTKYTLKSNISDTVDTVGPIAA